MTSAAALSRPRRLVVLAVLCGVCFVSGLVISAIGPTLPELAARSGRTPGALGLLFSALFLGMLCAQCVTYLYADRIGLRPVLTAGLIFYGVGVLALSASGALGAYALAALSMGIGWGLAGLAVNVLPAQLTARRLSMALNLVNLCYAVGAIAGPLLVAAAIRTVQTATAALLAGGVVLLLGVPFAARLVPRGPVVVAGPPPGVARTRLRSSRLLWSLAGLAFLYVGIENAAGGWTPTYLMQTLALDEAGAAAHTVAFWIALCGGRLLGTLFGVRAGARVLLRWSLAGSVVGGLLVLAAMGHHGATLAALAVLGLAYGPIYASLVELVTTAFPERPSAAMSVASALGGVGGMLLPWLQGVMLEELGGRTMGGLLLAAALGMAGCTVAARGVAGTSGCGVRAGRGGG